MQDSNEGVDDGNTEVGGGDVDNVDEDLDDEDDKPEEDDTDKKIDRVEQFRQAFESAKETDTFGYVLQPTLDNPKSEAKGAAVRTAKDLAAISWAAFCTGEKNNIGRDVMKIQALDMTNVLQRLQLAAAMLRDEKKKCMAKMVSAGIKDTMTDEE